MGGKIKIASTGIKPELKTRIWKFVKRRDTPFPTLKSFVDYHLYLAIEKEEKKMQNPQKQDPTG